MSLFASLVRLLGNSEDCYRSFGATVGWRARLLMVGLVAPKSRSHNVLLNLKCVAGGSRIMLVDPKHDGSYYRVPTDLSLSPTSLGPVLVVGSCFAEAWQKFITASVNHAECDLVATNNVGQLPGKPPRLVCEYSFQMVQLTLRGILGYPAKLSHSDLEGHQKLFTSATQRLKQQFATYMKWNREQGLLTFVANFMVAQQNPLGRLLPRYDLRNPVYFVEQLNVVLDQEIRNCRNAYLLDLDQISATFGRKYAQDDAAWILSHGSILSDFDHYHDRFRMERPQLMSEHYTLRVQPFMEATWAELVGMYRTIRQIDVVKLVAVDLDDTLWRGIAAEEQNEPDQITEGWPLGFIEALHFLKQRGVLLAIVSKNEDKRISQLWEDRVGGHIRLEDFAVRKINWKPKAENLHDIMRAVNILPRNVVFVDDSPVERAAVAAAFPDVRVIGSSPYYLRRVLLWSPETQVVAITDESSRRTEMIHAQIDREEFRNAIPREEFLASLGLKVHSQEIHGTDHRDFPRAFELLNKTNQFNTTGRRWSHEECLAAFNEGTVFFTFRVEDNLTAYGLVGIAITKQAIIEQFAMSCRVVGLDVEIAALSEISRRLRDRGFLEIYGHVQETDANFLCRDLFERCGFSRTPEGWVKPENVVIEGPSHVQLVSARDVARELPA
jgi:FkbH-like protein